jgi:hypothetical protein
MPHIDPALFAILAGIVLVLGLIALVPQRDVALAGIGVLGGSVITNYLMATNQDYRWALVATIAAVVMFVILLFTENVMLGFLAAVVGLLGAFLGVIAGWNVDFDVNAKDVPLGVILVIILVLLALGSFAGVRRRRARRVVTTTTT